jgi:hypothetical protein
VTVRQRKRDRRNHQCSDERKRPDERRQCLEGERPEPHMPFACGPAEVAVQNLALTSRPAAALLPERAECRRHLHSDERVRLESGVPAGDEQSPAEVDVLGRHPGVVPSGGHYGIAAEEPEHPCDDPYGADHRLRPADETDDRRGLDDLQ